MKKFKMPTAYTILLLLTAVVAVFTWIVPAGEYVEGVYSLKEANPQGIWQVLTAPIEGFFDARGIIMFILVIGGFLGVTMKTGALDAGIAKLLKVFKGKEHLLIPLLMILFGIGGSTYGMAEETIAFYPLIIVVFLAAGYDVITAIMVIMLGAGVGVLGSTINPFAIGVASEAIDIDLSVGMMHRFLLFILVEAAAIFWTMKYAAKVKKDKSKSIVADLHEGHVKHFLKDKNIEGAKFEKKHAAVLLVFGITFVIMILGVIPWAYKFGINIFDDLYNKVANLSPIFGLEPNTTATYWDNWDNIKTQSAALGDWWFGQMTVLFLISSVVIGFVGRLKEKEIVESFIQGAKDLLGVALIVGVARGVKLVMAAGGMDATLLNSGYEALKGFGQVAFINLTYLFYIPMSFLIPSTSGLAGVSMPIMGPLGQAIFSGAESGAALVITAFSGAEGVVNLITPTSGVVMGALALAKVPYERWLKHVGKFLLVLSAIVMVVLTISAVFA